MPNIRAMLNTQFRQTHHKGVDQAVNTVGIPALLIANKDASVDEVYAITKNIWSKIDEYKKNHSYLVLMTKERFLSGGLTEELLHPGAVKYYKEIGWMK